MHTQFAGGKHDQRPILELFHESIYFRIIDAYVLQLPSTNSLQFKQGPSVRIVS